MCIYIGILYIYIGILYIYNIYIYIYTYLYTYVYMQYSMYLCNRVKLEFVCIMDTGLYSNCDELGVYGTKRVFSRKKGKLECDVFSPTHGEFP